MGHLLARISCDLFRTDAGWAMRAPSFICGLLCIPAIFLLGRALANTATGLLAAALAALDWNVVWQMQQARMYTILLLAVIISLLAVNRAMNARCRAWRAWVLAGGGIALALWVHFSAVALCAAVLIGSLVLTASRMRSHEPRVVRLPVLGALLAIALAAMISAQGIFKLARVSTELVEVNTPSHRLADVWIAVSEVSGNWAVAILLSGGAWSCSGGAVAPWPRCSRGCWS